MKSECPNCKSVESKNIIRRDGGSNNIDNLPHSHLECKECGNQFNLWECSEKDIKKAFGEDYKLYL